MIYAPLDDQPSMTGHPNVEVVVKNSTAYFEVAAAKYCLGELHELK